MKQFFFVSYNNGSTTNSLKIESSVSLCYGIPEHVHEKRIKTQGLRFFQIIFSMKVPNLVQIVIILHSVRTLNLNISKILNVFFGKLKNGYCIDIILHQYDLQQLLDCCTQMLMIIDFPMNSNAMKCNENEILLLMKYLISILYEQHQIDI